MAKNFSVEVLISTAKATKDLHAAEGQVRALDRSLLNLSKTLKESNGNLDAAAKSIASIVASSKAAATASKDLAQAKITASKADAEQARNANASALSSVRLQREQAGLANTLANTARQQTMAANTADLLARRQNAASASTDRMGNSLSNQRYLLYDVGATYRTLALAAQALPAASLAVATSYEKSFAQVIRTSGATGEAVGVLRNELKTLATEIPMSFAELSSIAKIGGQMDIPAESLGRFTEVVAKFVATADGVTIDKATESFGRMANLFASGMNAQETSDFFQRLGSAISYTADNSVTSEAKISAMLEKIAPIGKSAGLSAVEITSFASALSSVGLAPEISSGFLTRFFGGMNKDIANNTETLQVYNKILGTTSKEFEEMYRNDPSGVLTNIVTELSKMDKISQTKLLGDLGVSGVRDIRVIQGLAQNLGVLEKAQKDTAEAFAKGDYLDKSSAGIFNTFAANLQKLANALANLGATMGSSILPVLSPIVQGITAFATGFDSLIKQVPALKAVLGVLMAFGSIAGVWFALKSAQAFLTAGMIGFQHVAKTSAGASMSLNGQTKMLATTMLMARGATEQQSAAMLRGASSAQALKIAMLGTIGQTNALSSSLSRSTIGANGFITAARGIGGSLLSFVGGPVGVAVAALAGLATAWWSTSQKAKESANTIVDAFAQSGEAGAEALGKAFATEKVGFLDNTSLSLIGKTWQDVAKIAGVSLKDVSTALSGTSQDLDAYIAKLNEIRAKKVEEGGIVTDQDVRALSALTDKLEGYRSGLVDAENTTLAATEANGGLATSFDDVGYESEDAALSIDEYIKKIGEAAAAAFGMVDAQSAVQASLEKLGAGLQKGTQFGSDSESGRNNLANLQATLVAQATLFQQQVEAEQITAQNAAVEYANFVKGLMSELTGMGVDTSQFESFANDAISRVQGVFNEQAPQMSIDIDTASFDNVTYALADMGSYLEANPLFAHMDLIGGDETARQVYDVVTYISEATGIPFQAVITALTNPAADESKAVMDYIANITSVPNTAVVTADTSTAITNVRNFAVYAQAQLGNIMVAMGGIMGNPVFGVIGTAMNAMRANDVLATPAIEGAKANKALIPTFGGIKRGYDDAAKGANKAGKAAKGAGKNGKKAGKDLGKAAKEAKKDWDEAEQAISGYASRIGNAFGYVFDKTQGVDVAKDEYYTILNGINERLEGQKQTLKDLRAENKALNAERAVQLNDAEKLEKMAKYADAMGNSERAKVYRDEAKALKASAAETKNKVDANNAEAKALEKGIGNLKGYSKEAIANRAELRNLEQASLAVATAYAKSGASAATVARETANWTSRAKTHSTQLGYTRKDVENVTSKTSAYINMLNRVPKTIKTNVTENKTTNLSAKNNTGSGVAAAKKSLGSVPGSKTSTINAKSSGIPGVKRELDGASKDRNAFLDMKFNAATKKRLSALSSMYLVTGNIGLSNTFGALSRLYKGGMVQGFASGGTIPGKSPSDPTVDNRLASVDGQGLIAVRSGEFITQEPAVDYYGSDIMNKINNMQIPRYALGGQIGNGNNSGSEMGGVVELGAETIQSLARLNEKVIYLYAGLEEIANSVNKGNAIIAQKGGVVG